MVTNTMYENENIWCGVLLPQSLINGTSTVLVLDCMCEWKIGKKKLAYLDRKNLVESTIPHFKRFVK